MNVRHQDVIDLASAEYGSSVDPEISQVQVLTINDTMIVLLESFVAAHGDSERGRNVFAFDRDGRELWRIEDAGVTFTDEDGNYIPQGYTFVSNVSGELHAFQPIGCDCTIDLATGKIIAEEQTK